MKTLALVAALTSMACTSIQSTRYPDDTVLTAPGGGKVRGLVQVNRSTLTLFLDFVDVVQTDLESTSALLVGEAKAMGATKVQLVSARTSPRGGWWSLLCLVACINSTELVALAVEEVVTVPKPEP